MILPACPYERQAAGVAACLMRFRLRADLPFPGYRDFGFARVTATPTRYSINIMVERREYKSQYLAAYKMLGRVLELQVADWAAVLSNALQV